MRNNGKNNAQNNGIVGRKLLASPRHVETPQKQSPAAERRRAHISETRISAIAQSAARCTQNKKALPLFLPGRVQPSVNDGAAGLRRRLPGCGEAGTLSAGRSRPCAFHRSRAFHRKDRKSVV